VSVKEVLQQLESCSGFLLVVVFLGGGGGGGGDTKQLL
jgi:hypothetical protein